MEDKDPPILLGIDAGGTRCRFAVLVAGRRHEVTLGAANVHTDRAGALTTLLSGIETVLKKAGQPPSNANHATVYAGIAGIVSEPQAKALAANLPGRKIKVEDDRRSAVVGALGNRTGTVIGLGTGSFVARQTQQGIRFLGGYGADLGDEASGYWIGKSLLSRILHVRDGLVAETPLTAAVWTRFDDNLKDLLQFAQAAKPSEMADLAPLVIGAAADGDKLAKNILETGVDYCIRCMKALGRESHEPVCLIGGLGPAYQAYFPDEIRSAIAPPSGSALDGALHLAAGLAAENG